MTTREPVRLRDLALTVFAGSARPWNVVIPLAAVFFTVLTFVGPILGADYQTLGDWLWLAAGVVGLVVVVLLPFAREWAGRAERQLETTEAAHLRVTIRNALQPLAENIALMPRMSPGKREAHLLVVAETAVAALRLVLDGVEGLRAVVYRLNEAETRMTCMAYHGRGGRNPADFVSGTARGDSAIDLVLNARLVFEPDLSALSESEYAGSGEGYRTFISVSIHNDEDAFGMLTVDAPQAGSLVALDAHVLEVVADMLAIAFAIAR